MMSRAFCCKGTLLRKDLTRYWPLWAMCLLTLLIAYPMVLGFAVHGRLVARTIYTVTATFGVCFAAIYAVICAACLFHYLHNTCSAYMLHALPITRDSFFATHVLSGLIFFAMPLSAATGTSVLILAQSGTEAVKGMLLCALMLMLVYCFFFALATLCMFFTGRTASAVLIYAVVNFVVLLIEVLLRLVIEPALYGIESSGKLFTLPAAPLVWLCTNAIREDTSSGVHIDQNTFSISWTYILILAAVGLLLLTAAWLLYRCRQMECAGEVITVRWLRPIYQIVFALLGALTLGLLLAVLITDGRFVHAQTTLLLCLCFGGFVGYMLAEMRLKKSVHVFRMRALLRFGCFAATLCLFVLAFYQDWFCIVRHIPDAEEVARVEVSSGYIGRGQIVLEDRQDVEELLALHQAFVEEAAQWDGGYTVYQCTLTYELTDGSTLTRVYDCAMLLGDEARTAQCRALLDTPDRVLEYFDSLDLWHAQSVELNSYLTTDFYGWYTLEQTQIADFMEALRQDVEAGTIEIFLPRVIELGSSASATIALPGGRYLYLNLPDDAERVMALVKELDLNEFGIEIVE